MHKNVNFSVPFYSNTSDNTHCFQAALKMVLKYFQPEKDFSWKKLEIITGKKEGLWTWPLTGLIWMKNNGYEVVDIDVFDFKKFIKDKEKYLIRFFGKESAIEQIRHSDINYEVANTRKLLDTSIIKKDIPSFETLKSLLAKGYLLICGINAKKLNGKKGFEGHFVVIKGFKGNTLLLHDPGLPPIENRKVPFNHFEKAWADPDEKAKSVMAFRRNSKKKFFNLLKKD